MRQTNTPLIIIIAILALMFVVPFVLALFTLLAYGQFALPTGLFGGVLAELDANFVLALFITALPLLLVWAVEANRRRAGGGRSLGFTLALIILLMLAVTAVPLVAFLRPLAGVPAGQALALVALIAFPLIVVLFAAAILLPGLTGRGGDGGPSPEE